MRIHARLLIAPLIMSGCMLGQSWEGTVAGVDIQAAGRPPEPGALSSGPSFVVYVQRDLTHPLRLICGSVDTGTGTVLFCGENLNKYAGRTVRTANYFNLIFTASGRDYLCVAAKQDSPLFCRVKASSKLIFTGNEQEFRLPPKAPGRR